MSCLGQLFSTLALLCIVVTIQTCFMWTIATDASDDLMSIDQTIVEALQASPSGGRMNHPGGQEGERRVELDMLVPEDQWREMIREQDTSGKITKRKRRKAMRKQSLRWPKAEVPYFLAGSFDSHHLEALRQAFAQYHNFTCIRFREKKEGDANSVCILDKGGCKSNVGCQGGVQLLYLDTRQCMKKNVVIHELGHVIGLVHEQSRPDRDDFVSIKKSNIRKEYQDDFANFSILQVDDSIDYDYLSIMHYSQYMASNNTSQPVIETKNASYQNIIGQMGSLSFRDIKQINLMYNCSERAKCPQRIRCPGEGFVGQDCKCYCPSPTTMNERLTYVNDRPVVLCSECVDYDDHCNLFRQRGFCSHRLFSSYMSFRCPRACDRCRAPASP